MPRPDYQTQALLPDVDRTLAVWSAYLNVVNAFNLLTTESESLATLGMTTSGMTTRPDLATFAFRLAVLDAQLKDERDEKWYGRKNGKPMDGQIDDRWKTLKYKSMPELMRAIKTGSDGADAFELFTYWENLDQLMKDSKYFKAKSTYLGKF